MRHATIFKPQHPYKRCVADTFKDLPSSALALLEVLLAVEPDARGTASSALQSEVNLELNSATRFRLQYVLHFLRTFTIYIIHTC